MIIFGGLCENNPESVHDDGEEHYSTRQGFQCGENGLDEQSEGAEIPQEPQHTNDADDPSDAYNPKHHYLANSVANAPHQHFHYRDESEAKIQEVPKDIFATEELLTQRRNSQNHFDYKNYVTY